MEISEIKDWCSAILNYMKNLPGDNEGIVMMIEAVSQCVSEKRIKELRIIKNDINEWADGLNRNDKAALNKILKEKFGMDLCDVNKRMAARIAAILKRGKIRNDDEFVRMSEWIDHLLWDDPDADNYDEINRIERLMNEYEERAAKKLDKGKH